MRIRQIVAFLIMMLGTSFSFAQTWDYTEKAPSANPDNGLYYEAKVNDAAGTKNGLKGIKMNSTGYCYFEKEHVAGTLKLTFGPRDGAKESSLNVYTYTSTPSAETLVATTPTVTECQTVGIELTAEQNNIYITRNAAVEQVLCKIQFVTGSAEEVTSCVVTYKDHKGNVIGKVDANEGDALGEIPFTEENLPLLSESEVFRGWVYASGVKAKPTDILTGNTTITALVTPYEIVDEGSVQNYNFTSNIFYPEDHELISVQGGYFHDSQHGWAIATDGKVSVQVAGNAQIVIGLCKYSKNAPITVTDEEGNVVQTIESAQVENDGATAVVNYKGLPTTLTFTFSQGESYIHKMIVYNVNDFVVKDEVSGYYIIPKNDAAALLLAINSANAEEGAKILLQNGTYDLGETVNITLSGKNMSIIGQSRDVIIKTAPNVKLEGLGKADLFYNTSDGLYMQNLTLRNALDYYSSGSAGRACAFHDSGNHTACYDVTLDSYQDTYYSHRDGSYFYWEKGTIMGTVDYMCGGANVYYNGVTLKNRSREKNLNRGECTMAAPYTAAKDKGYVYESCMIETESQTFNFGRSWNEGKCAYLNTTIKSGQLASSRWTLKGMNSSAVAFKEYRTVDKTGKTTCPASYKPTFTHTNGDRTYETILSDDEAKDYSYEAFFADAKWDPKSLTAQEEAKVASVTDSLLTMEEDGTYIVESGSGLVAIFCGTTLNYAFDKNRAYTVRKANARGGFGSKAGILFDTTDIKSIGSDKDVKVYDLNGRSLDKAVKGVNIINKKKVYVK